MKFFIILGTFVTLVQCVPLYMDHQVQEDYVPILGYHELGDVTNSLTVTVSDYRDQVDYLTNTMNCNWITMKDLTTYVAAGDKLPTKTCIMNFDDGTADHYHKAYCSLNEHSVPATFYVVTDDLNTSDFYLTTDEVADLDSKGHDIQPHTKTHPNLAQLSSAEQVAEIDGSKNDLEFLGYEVSTFAYPFGAYNDDTLDILRGNSDYLISRDTSQDFSWKDVRAPVVSFNEDYLLHFYYIKPEGLSGSQLGDLIKYIGWWQFEDNYDIVSGTTSQIKVRSGSSFHPTDTSYAVLLVSGVSSEISTQFITKFTGGFTLDMLVSGVSSTFDVAVDGVVYTSAAFPSNDPGYLTFTSSGSQVYVNHYVNIPSLSPGVHTLNIINTDGAEMILDKFRLFSNVDQDFSDSSTYNSCNPSTDAYCDCSYVPPPPPPDPMCDLGIIGSSAIGMNICCAASCGVCGGSNCGSLPGGSSECCGTPILNSGDSCDETSAPCVLTLPTSPPTPAPEPDPTCEFGIIGASALGMNICCAAECGTCGQTGCGSLFPGSSSMCCGGSILNSGVSCDDTNSPCIISMTPTPSPVSAPTPTPVSAPTPSPVSAPTPAPVSAPTLAPVTPSPTSLGSDPMCALGLIKQDICCPTTCGTCGGVGCGARPGGGQDCCGGPIRAAGLSCNDGVAPCVIGLP